MRATRQIAGVAGRRSISTYTTIGGPRSVPLHPDRDTIRKQALADLSLTEENPATYPDVGGGEGRFIPRYDPTTQAPIAGMQDATWGQIDEVLKRCMAAQEKWRRISGEDRVRIVMEMNDAIQALEGPLGVLETLEIGKIPTESRGELVEVYEVSACIQARTQEAGGPNPYPTRRYESSDAKRRELGWYGEEAQLPLGIVGKVTAFNFPCAVWGWGAFPALAAGNGCVLKPHPDAALISYSIVRVCGEVAARHGFDGLLGCVTMSDWGVSHKLWADPRVGMWEVTGSEAMGKAFMDVVGPSFRRSTLELGGNNAVIVHKDAVLDNVVESTMFGSTGTAGQRCTTTRIVYVHSDVYDDFVERFATSYKANVHIGDPLQPGVNVGPVHHSRSVNLYTQSVQYFKDAGSHLLVGGDVVEGNFVEPTVFLSPSISFEPVAEERFTPVVHVAKYNDSEVDDVINAINGTGYGLSCGVFTKDDAVFAKFRENVRVGLLNRNYGTSGAEAGENFGGEGKTGNGRMMGGRMFQAYTRPINSMISPADSEIVHAQGVDVKSTVN